MGDMAGAVVDLDEVPCERLETDLTTMAANIAAASALWLAWLAAYDRRKGYESWGCHSAAHWLNWKCGISLPTGYEKVRVARALESLPAVAGAFGRGELSYSKVRALTRVANVDNEADMLDMALAATASQLDRICGGINRAKRDADRDAATAFAERRVNSRSTGNGTTNISVAVPTDMAQRMLGGINARVDQIIAEGLATGRSRAEVVDEHGGLAALRADALADLLAGPPETPFVPAQISVLVDTDSTCQVDAIAVAPEVARRLACDAEVEVVAVNSEGAEVGTSAQARTLNRAQRRALGRRDHHMCRFPGCGSTCHLHAHHVKHRAHGGPTELDNMILVCSFHHHKLHEGGWNARSIEGGGFEFVRPNGESAPIGLSRGRVTGLMATTAAVDIGPTTIEQRSYSHIENLSWLTAIAIHNEELHRQRRCRTQP